jgi:hypothetical protein
MTVWAVSNPGSDFARTYREPDGSQMDILQKRVAGYGIIAMDKKNLRYTFNCYPIYGRLEDPDKAAQYPGWPKTVSMESNYGRKPAGHLPTLRFPAGTRPAIQVIHDETGEVIYSRRLTGTTYRPPVFAEGSYSIVVGEVGSTDVTILHHLEPVDEDQDEPIDVPIHESN